jgi:hypothetical protein
MNEEEDYEEKYYISYINSIDKYMIRETLSKRKNRILSIINIIDGN